MFRFCCGECDKCCPVGNDYEAFNRFVVPFNGNPLATVRIPIINDDIPEMTETFRVVLTGADDVVMIADGTATVEIIDTDG